MDVRPMLQELITRIKSQYVDFRFPISGWEGADFLNEDYHKWLAFYIKTFEPKKILELGRRNGNSLYSLSYFLPDSSILDSYDLNTHGHVVQKPNVNVYSYDGNFRNLDLNKYDFIFVDINGFGNLELDFLNCLIQQNYKGLVAWDDVGSQWCPDENFWDKIPEHIEKSKCSLHDGFFGVTKHT